MTSSKSRNFPIGEKAYNWKGDNISYYALHSWVRNRLGKPFMCEQCGKNDKNVRYEWSNIDGEYTRNLNDYIMLCVSCHRKRDYALKIRQKKDITANLKSAEIQASLSYANRLKVGAVLLKDGHIITNGRNGMPSGSSNICEDDEGNTRPEVIHAESNAICFAAKRGISTNDATLVVTHSPCFECSKLIKQSGIKVVYYKTEYRLTESLDFLKENGVKVEKIDEDN